MNVSIKVIEVLFNNHSFITFYLFIYLLLWHFSGTHVRTCVQVATPLVMNLNHNNVLVFTKFSKENPKKIKWHSR